MKIELIVPVAPDRGQSKMRANRFASLEGKVIGLLDNEWSSYDVFLSRIEHLLDRQVTKRIHHPQRRDVLPKLELDAMAKQLDMAIIGLGA